MQEVVSQTGAVIIRSPWERMRVLLDEVTPDAAFADKPIDMTVGEPKHPMPDFVMARMAEAASGFGQYPPIRGTAGLRGAISAWIERRYGVTVDPEEAILALNGSREGLYSAVGPAVERRAELAAPIVLIPNPFYQCYAAAAMAGGATPVFMPALEANGYLPDLDALAARPEILSRTVAFYLCSPSNPQGALADGNYLRRVIDLARQYDFMLFADECYSEIYSDAPPPGALDVAMAASGSTDHVVVFNSLSKRSNLPGLRSGFCAGDADFIARFARIRDVTSPQVPIPIQFVSQALWDDDTHVEENRALYRAKFDAADEVLGARYGYVRPPGAFFLWLKMNQFGGGEAATVRLWKGCGVKVLPGAYLSHLEADGPDPGSDYVRVAMVHDTDTTRAALERIVTVLS